MQRCICWLFCGLFFVWLQSKLSLKLQMSFVTSILFYIHVVCLCLVHTIFHELDICTRNYIWSYRILCMCIGHIFDKMCISLRGSNQLSHSQIPLAHVFFSVRARSRSNIIFFSCSLSLSLSLLTYAKTNQIKIFPSDQGGLNDYWCVSSI